MTTKLWATLASGALAAALAIGAAPIAGAASYEMPPAPTPAQTETGEAAIASPSTRVSGVLTDPQGHPLAGVELHFQEVISQDMFTVRTHAGGSFATALPSGPYDLRDENGAIIVSGVRVGRQTVSMGHVETPAPLAPTRLFDRQVIGEAIVHSPAASGALVRAPGGPVGPVTVVPAPHPLVQGGTPAGKAKAPAEGIPMGVEQQTQVPPEGETRIPSVPGEMGVPETGAQPTPMMPNTE